MELSSSFQRAEDHNYSSGFSFSLAGNRKETASMFIQTIYWSPFQTKDQKNGLQNKEIESKNQIIRSTDYINDSTCITMFTERVTYQDKVEPYSETEILCGPDHSY